MSIAQHYLAVGVDGDSLIWEWLCAGTRGDECRPDGRCQLIDFWHGMSDHGAYRRTPDRLDLISFTGTLAADAFVEDENGTDTLAFRMEWEYMEILVNGVPVPDVSCNIRQAGVVPVSTYRDEYVEHFGDEDDEPGALWETSGKPLRLSAADALWPMLPRLQWDYEGRQTIEGRDGFFEALRPAQD